MRMVLFGDWFEFDAGEATVAVLMGNRVVENMGGHYFGASADRDHRGGGAGSQAVFPPANSKLPIFNS
jgi:hypothetical protein